MVAVTDAQEQHTIDCIEACMGCARVCNACADDMIGVLPRGRDDLMVRCIGLCRDCTDIAFLSTHGSEERCALVHPGTGAFP